MTDSSLVSHLGDWLAFPSNEDREVNLVKSSGILYFNSLISCLQQRQGGVYYRDRDLGNLCLWIHSSHRETVGE